MTTPSNEQLATQIREVDQRSQRRHKSMLSTINKFKADINEQLAPFHDYLVGIEAIDKNDAKTTRSGGVVIDPKIADIIKWLVAAVLIALGGSKYL